MKKCSKCKIEKDESEFNKKSSRRDGLQTFCRECSKLKLKEHYIDNKQSYKTKKKRNRNYIRKFVYNYLKDKCCVDCGEKEICCLDFDHKDPNNKSFGITDAVRNFIAISKIEEEIEKCDVRCANCHRKRTAKQFGWYKFIDSSVV